MIINWKIKSGLNIFFQKLTPTPQPSHEFTFYDDYLGCHVSDAGRPARRCCWPAGGLGNDRDGQAAGDAGRVAVLGRLSSAWLLRLDIQASLQFVWGIPLMHTLMEVESLS